MKSKSIVGGIILPLRLVTSWLFLSAVLRRLILAPGKHDFDSPMWIGHKINTFFPHSNGPFKAMLGYLVENPIQMNWFTYVFTYSELIVGILLLVGFASRFTGLLLASLGIGLMHTAGWLGPTCLDEWQIASLLTTVGGVMLLFGSGSYSLDNYFNTKYPSLPKNKYWFYTTDPNLLLNSKYYKTIILSFSTVAVLYVMGTNQLLHGGVWGNLHNYSTKPDFVLDNFHKEGNIVSFDALRDKGPETYGAFITKVILLDSEENKIKEIDLSSKNKEDISLHNYYINKANFNSQSLVFPLGAKANVSIFATKDTNGIMLVDISGREFTIH
ncbi:TQO small subunit DoxD [Flammeovirga agarivorans]|uniref:DoxX family membrane protein n=1 Tax=Flammeovirga agarivorans TaxID=2726742 RepID=A0A7X8SL51_9BACT|nr:TQO small subunit DoxD [Flammeovirga agarivorans]NLR92138.1 DoxX family membrane protein [Flammeovirga agarivorans]